MFRMLSSNAGRILKAVGCAGVLLFTVAVAWAGMDFASLSREPPEKLPIFRSLEEASIWGFIWNGNESAIKMLNAELAKNKWTEKYREWLQMALTAATNKKLGEMYGATVQTICEPIEKD